MPSPLAGDRTIDRFPVVAMSSGRLWVGEMRPRRRAPSLFLCFEAGG